MRTLILLLTMFSSASTFAAEKILIPVAFGGLINGAHGALWKVELVGRNDGDRHTRVGPRFPCIITCPIEPAAPKSNFTYDLTGSVGGGQRFGRFLFVAEPGAEHVHFNLRLRDVSRQALTWGTEIPVIRERDVSIGPIHLLNVPTDERFRQALRVYAFDDLNETSARLRVYSMSSETPLIDGSILLSNSNVAVVDYPAQWHVDDLVASFPVLRSSSHVRIEILPEEEGVRVWALVSVNNNETQHVTMITPQ